MRIKRFNESTDQGWWVADRDKMERMMSRDRIDDFTDGEINLVKGLAQAYCDLVGSDARVDECRHLSELSFSMFGRSATMIRSTEFPGGKVVRPPKPASANNLFVTLRRSTSFDIVKSEDSYFYIYMLSTSVLSGYQNSLYVCEEVSGLAAFLKKMMGL